MGLRVPEENMDSFQVCETMYAGIPYHSSSMPADLHSKERGCL